MNKKDDNSTAVKLENPKTLEYQVVRSSLLPGILKTVRENKKHALPIKVFEVSDVVLKDDSLERKTRNERHVCAIYCAKVSGFEVKIFTSTLFLFLSQLTFLITCDIYSLFMGLLIVLWICLMLNLCLLMEMMLDII